VLRNLTIRRIRFAVIAVCDSSVCFVYQCDISRILRVPVAVWNDGEVKMCSNRIAPSIGEALGAVLVLMTEGSAVLHRTLFVTPMAQLRIIRPLRPAVAPRDSFRDSWVASSADGPFFRLTPDYDRVLLIANDEPLPMEGPLPGRVEETADLPYCLAGGEFHIRTP
jgi:hypothetical protein